MSEQYDQYLALNCKKNVAQLADVDAMSLTETPKMTKSEKRQKKRQEKRKKEKLRRRQAKEVLATASKDSDVSMFTESASSLNQSGSNLSMLSELNNGSSSSDDDQSRE